MARALWLALGLACSRGVVVLGRRGDERTAFVVAIAASLALTPIVWLHYFALLLVVVALAQPRLGLVWFVPLAMVITPGSGHPTPFETAWTLGVAAVVVALSVRASRAEVEPAGVRPRRAGGRRDGMSSSTRSAARRVTPTGPSLRPRSRSCASVRGRIAVWVGDAGLDVGALRGSCATAT